ncbi:unnamed protein product [Rotaria sp. Silwood1]|nr:unnamed protein product [Rotaria sp. Silwood1]CAF3509060.1 unnamed protein product [Rotaria sp. Silwood1]CAF4815685.1 unnamed protein product [Rotaria sp. Silwood1]
METLEGRKRHGGCMKFLGEYWALLIKMLLLTKRKRGQTIAEFLLAYIFLALLLGMRYLLDRNYYQARQITPFLPHESMLSNSTTANITYYYPYSVCTDTIVRTAVNNLAQNVPGFPTTVQSITDPTLSSLTNSTLETIFAFVYFTNIDNSCATAVSIPDQVQYTLRMQENGLTYYRAQQVKLYESDYFWKRSPEDYCQDNKTMLNYTTQFLGVQYFIDLSIIEYATNINQSISSIYMYHFGCPEVYLDQLHSGFNFFVPLFYSIIYVVTFILNVGYIVEERANKTKEYLRIFGLRTWVNNLVWVTRSMLIYFILTCISTLLSKVAFNGSSSQWNSASKAVFNNTHWTVLWTVLFVYSIQVSTFAVFFGQLFKRTLLAKLIGLIIWILTFIDYYSRAPVGLRYFLCLFPNAGLLFCIQVMEQYERRSSGMVTYGELYSNIFEYRLYIGLCLLLMLIYSVIYMFLAIYVERVNPGEFGISQPWNYLFKKSYWTSSAVVRPSDIGNNFSKIDNDISNNNHWIEMNNIEKKKNPSMKIDHLTKTFKNVQAVSNLSLDFYPGEVCTLLGHNGAGKTTTTFILVGMLKPTSGSVTIQGLDNQIHIEEVRHYLGFCPQYDILYDELSVEEHLELIAKMRHLDKQLMKESIEIILNLIGLTNDRNTLSKDLSGGMKRRLSIGISLINNPKVIILDEPTSGIDPYNRRLIWAIIRKLKLTGKCVLLTTHFLEEADVLSDRIAIMSRGRLQANGTPDFLKQRTDFEYRLLVDKQEECFSDRITQFIQEYVGNVVLERESAAELVYGIKRGESKQIELLINALDQNKQTIGINSYGLSMTTIEDVFLRLVQEEDENDPTQENTKRQLDDQVFRKQYQRVYGFDLFWTRVRALLIKRWHVSRRQISLFLGFFLLSIIAEILFVSAVPTPKEIQTSLSNNPRVTDAQVTLIPSIYNSQTIVAYANSNTNNIQTRLINYLTDTGATIVNITDDNVLNYVRARYYESEDIFVNKYQLSFAAYNNGTSSSPSLRMNAYFSTVNFHTMPTSLGVAATNLYQFYANSSSKSIVTINKPIITNPKSGSYLAEVISVLYCFEVFPISLFSFLNSIIAAIFIGILILTLVTERISHSKDLQLLTNLKKRIYWFSNWIFDFVLCLILISLLTIVVKIGAIANSKSDAEVHVYQNSSATGYFFFMYLMYTLASLPFLYVFSFIPNSSIMGFTNFFIINIITCVIDAVVTSFTVFIKNDTPSAGPTKVYTIVNVIRSIFAVLLPTVNLKQALSNIQLHENTGCISVYNSLIGTKFSTNDSLMSTSRPGVGAQFIIFFVQIIFWWIILIVIESRRRIRQCCHGCCCCGNDLADSTLTDEWNDSLLDEDVRRERQLILQDNEMSKTSVIVVEDLVKKFTKRKAKSSGKQNYLAVNHLNFHVQKRACFGLLGANGAGKTTTFRMLVNDIKSTSGKIIINGKNMNEMKRDLEIGFCPQFDWLIYDLTVSETLTLFARLKGVEASEISEMCNNMINIFGLEMYGNRQVQKLSGGNKRKVSAALAFMANPALVFLDEPTTGLDAAAKRKLWKVIRAARDVGLTIIMTSHSMEECEALCTKIGIMKMGQFMCLGNLQHLRNRFGNGYAVKVKVAGDNVDNVKVELMSDLPGLEIQDQHNEVLFCNVPFSYSSTDEENPTKLPYNLASVFEILNGKKEHKIIESYSVTQTTLEQIFVQLAGEDEDASSDRRDNNEQTIPPTTTRL